MNSMLDALIFLMKKIIDILYPKTCIICSKYDKDYICDKCYKDISNRYSIKNIRFKNRSFNELIYLFEYDNIIRKLLIDYKFNDKAYLHEVFEKFILKNEKIATKIKSYDIIIPVPIHVLRRRKRGYDQSKLIAKNIARHFNKLEYVGDVLIKEKNTKRQSSLIKKQRYENVKGVYKIHNKEKILDKKIILFDDIYTTGATAEECARNLKLNGAKDILVLTIAKD